MERLKQLQTEKTKFEGVSVRERAKRYEDQKSERTKENGVLLLARIPKVDSSQSMKHGVGFGSSLRSKIVH
jgi:hypothetical protein